MRDLLELGAEPFAIFSDVHANMSALKVCFQDLRQQEAKWGCRFSCFNLGDAIDAGPRPSEVVKLLKQNCQVHILGNHEDYLIEHQEGKNSRRYSSALWRFIPWTLHDLGGEGFADFCKELRFSWSSPDGFFRLIHASFERNDRMPAFLEWEGVPEAEDRVFDGSCERLTLMGHTHISGIYRQPQNELWVNAGSVGYPFLKKPAKVRWRPHTNYVFGAYLPEKRRVWLCVRVLAYDLKDLVADWVGAGVLEHCAPYSRAIFLQAVLNQSIVFQAFRKFTQQKLSEEQLATALAAHLQETGLNEECERILNEVS